MTFLSAHIKRTPLRLVAATEEIQPYKADGVTNRERKRTDFLNARTILPARRERQQRHRRHRLKVLHTNPMHNMMLPSKVALPRKSMGSRHRFR